MLYFLGVYVYITFLLFAHVFSLITCSRNA